MKNNAAAVASTLMALISTAEAFISTPGSTSNGRGNRATSTCTATAARVPSGCTSASLASCSRSGDIRRRRGTGALRLQAKGGEAPGAGAATEKLQRGATRASMPSSAESAIDSKRQGEVEKLKSDLRREHAVVDFLFFLQQRVVENDTCTWSVVHVSVCPMYL